jgi:putative ABC transport system substrate-binding protein
MPDPKGDSEHEARVRAFKQELAKLGWTDGGNIRFDERWPSDNMDRVRAEAADLVASNPDIIVTYGGRVVPVFMRLTRSIPMVPRARAIRSASATRKAWRIPAAM